MFELTLIAAGLTIVSTLYEYFLYFVVAAGPIRYLMALIPVAVFLYIVATPIGKEIMFGLAKDFKEDLIEGGKPAAYLDFAGLLAMVVIGNFSRSVIIARATGQSYTTGMVMGALLSIIALS
jgi:hypothetical protein